MAASIILLSSPALLLNPRVILPANRVGARTELNMEMKRETTWYGQNVIIDDSTVENKLKEVTKELQLMIAAATQHEAAAGAANQELSSTLNELDTLRDENAAAAQAMAAARSPVCYDSYRYLILNCRERGKDRAGAESPFKNPAIFSCL